MSDKIIDISAVSKKTQDMLAKKAEAATTTPEGLKVVKVPDMEELVTMHKQVAVNLQAGLHRLTLLHHQSKGRGRPSTGELLEILTNLTSLFQIKEWTTQKYMSKHATRGVATELRLAAAVEALVRKGVITEDDIDEGIKSIHAKAEASLAESSDKPSENGVDSSVDEEKKEGEG